MSGKTRRRQLFLSKPHPPPKTPQKSQPQPTHPQPKPKKKLIQMGGNQLFYSLFFRLLILLSSGEHKLWDKNPSYFKSCLNSLQVIFHIWLSDADLEFLQCLINFWKRHSPNHFFHGTKTWYIEEMVLRLPSSIPSKSNCRGSKQQSSTSCNSPSYSSSSTSSCSNNIQQILICQVQEPRKAIRCIQRLMHIL